MTSDAHSIRKHAVCSASSAHRWLLCPASVGECYKLPPEEPSEHALQGTEAHELAESVFKLWESQKFDTNFNPSPPHDDVDMEMWGHTLSYIKAVRDIVALFDKPPNIKFEQSLTLNEDMKMYGTADVVITGNIGSECVGYVIDLKYGKTKVVAKDNAQLAYYAVALKKSSSLNLTKVHVVIYQPRIPKGVTEVVYDTTDLDTWHSVLTLGAEKALFQIISPASRAYFMGDHCKWCNARKVCPERNKTSTNVVTEFEAI